MRCDFEPNCSVGDGPSERLRSSPLREALMMASMVDLSSWIWKAWGGRAESELEPASRRPLSGILREFILAVEMVFANVERRRRFPAAEEPQDIGRMYAEQAGQVLLSKRMGTRCCRELSLGGQIVGSGGDCLGQIRLDWPKQTL